MMRNVLLALIVAAFILGCGQKGPLYHPADKPAAKKQDKPAEQSSKDSDPKRQTQ
jgi:predicted small lipoprotein YifL